MRSFVCGMLPDKSRRGSEGERVYDPATKAHVEFAGVVACLDTCVDVIYGNFGRKDLRGNTLMIFSSDNGPMGKGIQMPFFDINQLTGHLKLIN